MPRSLDKKTDIGIAAVMAAFLVLAVVAIWQIATSPVRRMQGVVTLCGSLGFAALLGYTRALARRGSRERLATEKELRDVEELNLKMIESSMACVALLDMGGHCKVINSAMWKWIEELGLQPVEGMPWLNVWTGGMRRAAEKVMATAVAGQVGRFEGLCEMRSGKGRWYEVSVTPLCVGGDRPVQLLAVARNVTESHSAEEKFKVLFDHSPNANFIFDGGRVLACNSAAVELLGFAKIEDVAGTDVAALSPEVQPDGSFSESRRAEVWEIVRDVGHFRYHWQAKKVGGEEFPVEIAITPVWADGREVLLAVWTDLTERRQAETMLQESEERFHTFMEHSPTLCFIKDDQGRMLFVNRVMAKAFGVTREEMVGKTDFDWLPEETAEAIRQIDRSIIENNRASKQVEMISTAEGAMHEWLVMKFPIVGPDGRRFLGGVGMDVRDQRRAERALKVREFTFRELFDEAPVAYHELDTEGRIVRVNKTELALLGYSADEMVGRHVWEFCVETVSREAVAEKLRGGGNFDEAFQRHFIHKDGSKIPVLIRDRRIRDSSGSPR